MGGGDNKKDDDDDDVDKTQGGDKMSSSHRSSRDRRSSSHHSRKRDRKKRKKHHRSSSRSRRSSRRRSRSRGSSRSRSRTHRRSKHRRRDRKDRKDRRRRSISSDDDDDDDKQRKQQQMQHEVKKAPSRVPLSSVLPSLSEAPSIAQMMQMNPSCSLQEVMSKIQMNRNYATLDTKMMEKNDDDDDERKKKEDQESQDHDPCPHVQMTAAQLKAAKELYVANIHPSVQSQQLQDFLGNIIQQVGLIGTPGNPIVATWMSSEGRYAFCEFRTVEECTLALMLNGLSLMGQQLTCGRPKTYAGRAVRMPNVTARTSTSLANLGCTTNLQWFTSGGAHSAPLPRHLLPSAAKRPTVLHMPERATSNSILMTNLPTTLDSEQVEELVRPFGPVRFFILLEDECGESSGRAVFEYLDVALVETVVAGLNGLEIQGQQIQLKRAPVKAKVKEIVPSRVLRFSNMISLHELQQEEEYQDILLDVEEECLKYGPIVQVMIPRPSTTTTTSSSSQAETTPGMFQVFIEYKTIDSSTLAMKRCNGRTFGSNTISATFYDEMKFSRQELE